MFSLRSLKGITDRPEQTQIALGVVALLALIFGWWQLKSSIYLPLGLSTNTSVTNQSETLALGDNILALQQQDSDSDGLTDYDELYLYGTSPYLTDTDSDGYSDKMEVDSGNNPNCAPDTTCGPVFIAPTATESSIGGTPTAEDIRALLRQAGVSDDEIAKYDDIKLLQIYNEVAGEVSATDTSDQSDSNSSINLTPEQKELIKQMSGDELRQFLINGGADSATLEQVDDATLRTIIYQELGV